MSIALQINAIKDFLNQNWLGTAIGLIGIIIGVVVAYAYKARPRLAARKNTLELVGANAVLPDEIEFLFRGNKVPKVTMSRVAIWNIGNTTVHGGQIVASDPLRIITSAESTILDATIRQRTRSVNDFSCVLRQGTTNEIECRFDYLDPGDGALIQVIHTGDDELKILGTMREVPKGILLLGNKPKPKPQKEAPLTPLMAKLLATIFLIIGLAALALSFAEVLPPEFGRAAGIVFTVAGLILLLAVRYIPPTGLSTDMNAPLSNANTQK
jgi:hypothetical protein